MVFGHVVLKIHGISPWRCNKTFLHIKNIHGKVWVNING